MEERPEQPTSHDMPFSVLIAGATGLVGGACLERLLGDEAFERVHVLTRRPLPERLSADRPGSKLVEHVVDFDRLGDHAELFRVDKIFCCLGTTIKKAGSKAQFRKVDFGYPDAMARLGRSGGASHFLLVSAIGADPDSRIFYNRVKGEVEAAILDRAFEATTIVRPSLLLGDRDEFRLGEEIAARLSFLLPSKYKPVAADDVAAVLVDEARREAPPQSSEDATRNGPAARIIESREIRERASGLS